MPATEAGNRAADWPGHSWLEQPSSSSDSGTPAKGRGVDRREAGLFGRRLKSARLSIIVILLDDLGWRDAGCFGIDFHETPDTDRLAAQGTDHSRQIPFYEDDRTELYDSNREIAQRNDLAAGLPEKTTELPTLPEDWLEQVDASMCPPNPDCSPRP